MAADPFQANDDVSFRLPRLLDPVAWEGCVIGSGDAPRDGPRQRAVLVPEGARVVEDAEEKGCESLWEELSSSSVNETKRRERDRTVEVEVVPALPVFRPEKALVRLF